MFLFGALVNIPTANCQPNQTLFDGQEMIVHLSIDVDFDVDILVVPALRPGALIPKDNFLFDASSSQFIIHRSGLSQCGEESLASFCLVFISNSPIPL